MARAISSLPVPDSPVTRIVEFGIFDALDVARHVGHRRLLKTIPGSELPDGIVVTAGRVLRQRSGRLMRVGQVRNVAQRVEFFCLLRRQRSNTTTVKSRAFACCDGKASKRQIAWSPSLRGLRTSLACERFGYRVLANGDLLIFQSFSPAQLGLPAIEVAQIDRP